MPSSCSCSRAARRPEKDAIAAPRHVLTLDSLFAQYRDSLPSNEDSTLYTERVHQNHFLRLMGEGREVEGIDFNAIQGYVDKRKQGYHLGKRFYGRVGPGTIGKELKTLGKLWNWGILRGIVNKPKPWVVKNLDMGREKKRERFRDFDEISEIIADGGLSAAEQLAHWRSLYLRGPEVADLLAHVESHATAPFVLPMFTLCALTGCRRSEAMRSLKRDFNFRVGIVTIREKKKDNSQEFTLRDVPMNAQLAKVMRAWFDAHPGGQFAICDENGERITIRSGRVDREFEDTLAGSKWAVMRGWHCLRHSFASILASKGIDQRIINKFMGHLDEKTVARYQHLYKETGQDAVNNLLT